MLNFRSLPIISPHTNRPHFYRSGEIITIHNDDIEYLLNTLHINYFFDLRSKEELNKNGYPIEAIKKGLKYSCFPLEADGDYFRNKKYPTPKDYYEYNVSLLENNQTIFFSIFKFIETHPDQTILFGCYAGKDRTGLLAILISLMYNLPENIIIQDYLQTGPSLLNNLDYFKKNWIKKGISRDEYAKRMQPKKETIIMLLDHIQSHYQGINGYLKHIGL